MKKNVAIFCEYLDCLENIVNNFPTNTYIIISCNFNKNKLYESIDFFISNDCCDIYVMFNQISNEIEELKKKYKNLNFYTNFENIESYTSKKKIILLNQNNQKIEKKLKNSIIDFYKINTTRKDANSKKTISKIKNILKKNNYKVKEKGIRRNFNGIYSIRLELNHNKGSNGKGITLNLAKASAYAELMERLQSNMLNKKRISTNSINKNLDLYLPLLNNASNKYKDEFFKLDDIYFNVEKALNIKTNKYEAIPINAINCFCHTNGLASGNSFSEAVSQAIFEILERHCYQSLLNSNINVKNIDVSKYPLNPSNIKILNKLEKLGYKYVVKDCSLGKYPVLGFLLFNNDMSKYTFTIASDYSLDIALSRCITEMMQGLKLNELNNKMLNTISLNELDKKYQKNYKSYNWLKCFNNNIGYLPNGFFCDEFVDISKLKFKGYLSKNDEVLENLKKDIEYEIFVKDYNILGFDTYRVYIPYITAVDCYDIDDLLVNKNYNKLSSIYLNIYKTKKKDINFFIDIFLKLNKNIKYDELIKPCDLFHINETTDYFKLDFTSLLIVLMILVNREKDLCDLLEYKINNFNLSDIKINTYKIIINILSNNTTYNISNAEIENYIKNIMNNPKDYLLSLNPYYKDDKPLLANKKSLNWTFF